MSQVKQISKRKRLIKAAGVPALAGLGLSLVGSASASALATADLPQSLNTTPNQRVVLGEEEIVDVSLATFHVFDKENGTGGFTRLAMGAGGCGCGTGKGCGFRGFGESSGSSGSGSSGGRRGGGGGCCASWGSCRHC